MKSTIDRVEEFHMVMGIKPISGPPTDDEKRALVILSAYLAGFANEIKEHTRHKSSPYLLRARLMLEELGEVLEAMGLEARAATLQELVDLRYVSDGTIAALGFGPVFEAAFAEVHRANMSKLDNDGRPVVDGSGKIVKGPNYQPPNLEPFVNVY